jgi:hypothetical protein
MLKIEKVVVHSSDGKQYVFDPSALKLPDDKRKALEKVLSSSGETALTEQEGRLIKGDRATIQGDDVVLGGNYVLVNFGLKWLSV